MWQTTPTIETEEEYFHRHDAELIAEMRRRAADEERRRCLIEAAHIQDPKVLEALGELGYTSTTVPLIRLVPMIQVAWATGSVSDAELRCILAAADRIGVKENTPAYPQLEEWLDKRPSDRFFWGTLGAIRTMIASKPVEECRACREAVLQSCKDVAAACYGFWGWATGVCSVKRKLVREITELLDPDRQTANTKTPKG